MSVIDVPIHPIEQEIGFEIKDGKVVFTIKIKDNKEEKDNGKTHS